MKRFFITAALLIACGLAADAQNLYQTRRDRLEKHVYYFAADSLRGRKAGSEDARKVARYIRNQFEAMGLEPYYEDWYQDFNIDGDTYRNVVAFIQGSDPVLSKEIIILGAHYDHLGVKDNGEVYNGADDNASGTAALIEVARVLASQRETLKRSFIIAAFDGEELGLYGSKKLAKRLSAEKANIRLMVSMDMVGWLEKGKTLKLEGVATLKDGKEIIENKAAHFDLAVKTKNFETSLLTATDTEGFALNGVPTLAVTTGLKSPYHKTGDDAELIDYAGLDKITGYMAELSADFANSKSLSPSGKLAMKHTKSPASDFSIGLTAGFGSSYIDFHDAAFTGKTSSGWQAGAYLRYDYKVTGIKVAALVDTRSAMFPDPANPFSSKGMLRQQGLTVPAEILLQIPTSVFSTWVGIGAYGSRMFGDAIYGYTPNKWQAGSAVSWGWRMGKLVMELQWLSQWNDLFESGMKSSMETTTFMLGWQF